MFKVEPGCNTKGQDESPELAGAAPAPSELGREFGAQGFWLIPLRLP